MTSNPPQEDIDTSSSGGRLVFSISEFLAEFERNLIRELTQAGLTAAHAVSSFSKIRDNQSMAERYELRTLDELDGLAGDPIAPRWKEYEWPIAPGLDAKDLEGGSAAYRLAMDKDWWALDDLAKVVCGETKVGVGHHWYVVPPVELMKVLAVMRMIGADRFIEFVMPPKYKEIQEKQGNSISNQIREAMQLSKQTEN